MRRLIIYLLDYAFAKLLPALLNLATIYVFSNHYNTHQYGAYLLSFTVVSVSNSILFYWPRLSYLNKRAEKKDIVYTNVVFIYFILSVLFTIGYALFAFTNGYTFFSFFAIVFSCVSQAYFEFKTEIIRVYLNSKKYALFFVLRSILFLLMVYISIRINSEIKWEYIILMLGGSYLLPALLLRIEEGFSFKFFDYDELKGLIAFGLPLLFSYSMEGIISSLDRFMLGKFYSESIVAYYTSTQLIFKQGLGLVGLVIYLAIYPIILRYDKKKGVQLYTIIFLSIVCSIFIAFYLVSQPFLRIFYSKDFFIHIKESIPLFTIYTALYVIKTYYGDIVAQFLEKSNLLIYSSILMVIINVSLNYYLIPLFAIDGALYSAAAAYLTSFIFVITSIYIIKIKSKKEV